jgi:KduI/IolB family
VADGVVNRTAVVHGPGPRGLRHRRMLPFCSRGAVGATVEHERMQAIEKYSRVRTAFAACARLHQGHREPLTLAGAAFECALLRQRGGAAGGDGDGVLVPGGYRSYYLNVMAGPACTWVLHNDPDHEWLMTPAPAQIGD